MVAGARNGKTKLVLTLDAAKIGQIAAVLVGTIVMAVCFFVRQADGFEVAFRALLSAAVAYHAAYFLARKIMRELLFEVIRLKQKERQRHKEKAAEEEVEEASMIGPMPEAEGV